MNTAKRRKLLYIPLAVIIMGLLVIPTLIVWGADFVPLTDLPDKFITNNDPGTFFNSFFRYGVIIAGFLAVIMIVIAGFEYMTTDAVSGKSDAKDRIVSALSGLFLILLSFILLSIINPDILSFSLFK
ncbi:MAG TPA: hypothetical protein VJH21_01810 [Candidatus Paceibacterota bacterium]